SSHSAANQDTSQPAGTAHRLASLGTDAGSPPTSSHSIRSSDLPLVSGTTATANTQDTTPIAANRKNTCPVPIASSTGKNRPTNRFPVQLANVATDIAGSRTRSGKISPSRIHDILPQLNE